MQNIILLTNHLFKLLLVLGVGFVDASQRNNDTHNDIHQKHPNNDVNEQDDDLNKHNISFALSDLISQVTKVRKDAIVALKRKGGNFDKRRGHVIEV